MCWPTQLHFQLWWYLNWSTEVLSVQSCKASSKQGFFLMVKKLHQSEYFLSKKVWNIYLRVNVPYLYLQIDNCYHVFLGTLLPQVPKGRVKRHLAFKSQYIKSSLDFAKYFCIGLIALVIRYSKVCCLFNIYLFL